jgi:hypothetical protein
VSDQQPPADELAAIRAQLKTLGERESALKALMINDPSARSGNAWAVTVREVTTQRTDLRELRAMHEELVAEFTFPVKTLRVELLAIDEDGVLTRVRTK